MFPLCNQRPSSFLLILVILKNDRKTTAIFILHTFHSIFISRNCQLLRNKWKTFIKRINYMKKFSAHIRSKFHSVSQIFAVLQRKYSTGFSLYFHIFFITLFPSAKSEMHDRNWFASDTRYNNNQFDFMASQNICVCISGTVADWISQYELHHSTSTKYEKYQIFSFLLQKRERVQEINSLKFTSNTNDRTVRIPKSHDLYVKVVFHIKKMIFRNFLFAALFDIHRSNKTHWLFLKFVFRFLTFYILLCFSDSDSKLSPRLNRQ